jgi:hypothetical protein
MWIKLSLGTRRTRNIIRILTMGPKTVEQSFTAEVVKVSDLTYPLRARPRVRIWPPSVKNLFRAIAAGSCTHGGRVREYNA